MVDYYEFFLVCCNKGRPLELGQMGVLQCRRADERTKCVLDQQYKRIERTEVLHGRKLR